MFIFKNNSRGSRSRRNYNIKEVPSVFFRFHVLLGGDSIDKCDELNHSGKPGCKGDGGHLVTLKPNKEKEKTHQRSNTYKQMIGYSIVKHSFYVCNKSLI